MRQCTSNEMDCRVQKLRIGQGGLICFHYGLRRVEPGNQTLLKTRSGSKWTTNLSDEFQILLKRQLGITVCLSDTPVGRKEVSDTDIFGYIYGILHSPRYRTRYAEFLKDDFPHLPLPGNLGLFGSLARLGEDLVALHLMESPTLDDFITTYTGPKNPEITRVSWAGDTVWLDATATKKGQPSTPSTIGFRAVPEAVWNFHIGGYQVCEKWLKDRKGRRLSDDDIAHYQKIVVAIAETIRLMREIDEVIDAHGGWPGAFQTGAVSVETSDLETADLDATT